MLEHAHKAAGLLNHRSRDEDEAPERGFSALRILTAHLLVATGAGAALDALPEGADEPDALAGSYAARWAPALLAPLAAAAQVAHALRPSPATATATRLLNAAVVGLGVAGFVESVQAGTARGEPPSLAPLALGSAGVLGILLDREERLTRAEQRRLERRADLVERLVPRRRPKLDHFVVHV